MQTRAAARGSQNVLSGGGEGVCTNEKILLLVLTTVEAEVINSCNFLVAVQEIVETTVVMSVRIDVIDSI